MGEIKIEDDRGGGTAADHVCDIESVGPHSLERGGRTVRSSAIEQIRRHIQGVVPDAHFWIIGQERGVRLDRVQKIGARRIARLRDSDTLKIRTVLYICPGKI